MTDTVEKLVGRVSEIDIKTTVMSKEIELMADFFKESMNRQDTNIEKVSRIVEETKESNDLMREALAIQKKDIEHRIKEFELTFENKQLEKENTKLSLKEHALKWWDSPLSKLSSGIVLILLGWMATRLGLPIDQILK